MRYYYNRTTGVTQWSAPLPLAVNKAAPVASRKRSNPGRVLALESTDCSAATASDGIDENHQDSSTEHGKDYQHMAKEYRSMQKYRDLKGK
jgi:hypothetical protein